MRRREEDDFAAWRIQRENQEAPFPHVYPDMPPRFRRCRALAGALYTVERGAGWGACLGSVPLCVWMLAVSLLRGREALDRSGAMGLGSLLLLILFLGLAARQLRRTVRFLWRCPCCRRPFPCCTPEGRGEALREKECCEALRQMGIGAVKPRLCPLVIPSECPWCRRKFFRLPEGVPRWKF